MTKQIARFDDELEKLALRIEVAQESMREAFADLKKVEIVDRSRKEAQAKEQAKKEMMFWMKSAYKCTAGSRIRKTNSL